ncbi:Cupredoxin [Xylogone sp. PMI_703]|nr:Cupredoxin [Xylogone sp. PMI_703]
MRFFAAPILLAGVALAQDYGGGSNNNNAKTTSTSSPAPSGTSAAANGIQTIVAGQSGLTFSPNSVTAAVGSIVEIQFDAPGHTFTSSSFSSPCVGNDSSIFSGVIGAGGSGTATNVFTITINDTNPIWFYCAVPGHCQAGMVGVINPPSGGSQTLAAYKAAAANAGSSFTPASVQGGVVGPARAVTSPSSSSSTTPTPSPSKPGAASFSTGSVSWVAVLITSIAAWGVSSLLM